MTIKGIQKKLNNMTKSQLERVCSKIKCPQGTKKQMIINLLRPFTKNKYGMSDMDVNDLNMYVGYDKHAEKFDYIEKKEMVRKMSEDELHKIKRLFKKHKEQENKLMKENGKWEKDIYYSVEGDSAWYNKKTPKPCCSKCEVSWWDTLTFNDQYTCSPCDELPKYGGYIYNPKNSQKYCTPLRKKTPQTIIKK